MKKIKHFLSLLTIIILTSCNNGQTSNATTPGDDLTTLKELTKKWNNCIVKQDLQTLATLYAESVSLIGSSISKAEVISYRERFLKKYPDYNQVITGDITVIKVTDRQYKVEFPLLLSYNDATDNVHSNLVFDKVAGSWKITHDSEIEFGIVENKDGKDVAVGTAIGESLKGDFDGDGNTETAVIHLVKAGAPDFSTWKMSIDFSNKNISSIPFESDQEYAGLINEGKLDNDAGDELSVLTPPNHGTWNSIQTYTFKNASWKKLMEAVSYQDISFEDSKENDKVKKPEDMIFKENGTVYYYDYDLNDENFKLIKKKATLK